MFKRPFSQFSNRNLLDLLWLLGSVQARDVLEIGCWIGTSTAALCLGAEKMNGRVTVIDTFDGGGSCLGDWTNRMDVKKDFIQNMTDIGVRDMIEILHGTSDAMREFVPHRSQDLIFIDGDHRYSQVKRDIENYLPKLRFGGVICGHDYDSREYDEAFIETDFKNGVHHGVTKAVNEAFSGNHKVTGNIWYIYV